MILGSARRRRGSPARSGDFMESRRLGGSGRDALLRVRPTGNRHDVAAAGIGEAGELRAGKHWACVRHFVPFTFSA